MEEILSRARQVAESAEVFRVTSRTTPVHFEANRLKEVQAKESTSTALRLIKNGRLGFAQANGFVQPETIVEMAAETCQYGMPVKFSFPRLRSYPEIKTLDPNIDKTTIQNMVELGQGLIAAIRQHTPEIVSEVSITKGMASVNIINSEGGEAGYEKSFFSLDFEGVLVQNEDMLFVGDSQSSCRPITDFRPVAEEVIRQLELAKSNVAISTKSMPVIFTPIGVASSLIAPLASAFNGKMVFDGASPLKDKLGERFLDSKFTLWDDPTLPYQVGSYPCDDEGVPGQRKPLIDHGVISHFLYDLQTAGLANVQSTGNGSRHGGLPTPSPSSLVIDTGNVAFHDMVKGVREGLVIDMLMGAEQGNILNGDFSGNVLLGYKIEGGEITGRVKNTMVAGNVYQILANLEAIGNESRWVGGFIRTPHLCCSNLSVAAKTA